VPPAALVLLPAVQGSGGGGGEAGGGGGAASNLGAASSIDYGGGASVMSRQSAAAGGGGGGRGLGAVEARALHWLSWAQRVVASAAAATAGAAADEGGRQAAGAGADAAAPAGSSAGGGDAGPFAEAAAGLAAAPPFVAPLSSLRIASLHDAAPAGQMARVANGALVALIASSADQPLPGPDPHLRQHQGGQPLAAPGSGAGGAAPRPCLGLGLVRAADSAVGALYLLTDAPPDCLARVGELHVGRMDLPQALLGGGPAGAAPYDALFCLTAAASGAGAHKSRNNLLRASLLPQAQRGCGSGARR
jgi:hypothetical protein